MSLIEILTWCWGGIGVMLVILLALAIRQLRRKKKDGLVDAILKIADQLEK